MHFQMKMWILPFEDIAKMKKKTPFRFFQFFTFAILFLFMSILTIVTITAYSRVSGSTGLSMVKVQQMRVIISAKPDSGRLEEKSL